MYTLGASFAVLNLRTNKGIGFYKISVSLYNSPRQGAKEYTLGASFATWILHLRGRMPKGIEVGSGAEVQPVDKARKELARANPGKATRTACPYIYGSLQPPSCRRKRTKGATPKRR